MILWVLKRKRNNMPRKIYVASSWRNQHQNSVVRACRALGHEVYDFKNPKLDDKGFTWSEIDQDWLNWTPKNYVNILHDSPIVAAGFKNDMDALLWCDTCILLLPCGRSAHLEAGYCIGQSKKTFVFVSNEKFEPDLMYKMANMVTSNREDIYNAL